MPIAAKHITTLLVALSLTITGKAQERIAMLPIEFKDLKFTTEERLDSIGQELQGWINKQHLTKTFNVTILSKITIDEKFSVYGANTASKYDARLPEAVEKACRALDAKTDFTKINHLMVILAGESESYGAAAEHFWPQYMTFSIPLILDGKTFKAFASATELAWNGKPCGIGDLCHETGHLLGLPDFYDTDGALSGGYGACFYSTLSVMDEGFRDSLSNHPVDFGAAELFCLGAGTRINTPENTTKNAGEPARYELEDIAKTGSYQTFAIRDSVNILLEHREGKGLLISRVDKSKAPAGTSSYWGKVLTALQRWNFNEVNCNPDYQCAAAIPAIQRPKSVAEVFFPQPGCDYWFDETSTNAVTDISTESGKSTFRILNPLEIVSLSATQNCAFIKLETRFPAGEADSCVIRYHIEDSTTVASSTLTSPADSFSTTITGLLPDTDYILNATLHDNKGRTYTRQTRFHTDKIIKGLRPFIYLANVERNADGSFKTGAQLPLQLYNSSAEHIEWTFDGKVLKDGILQIESSGVLQASFSDEGGRQVIIRKTINAR